LVLVRGQTDSWHWWRYLEKPFPTAKAGQRGSSKSRLDRQPAAAPRPAQHFRITPSAGQQKRQGHIQKHPQPSQLPIYCPHCIEIQYIDSLRHGDGRRLCAKGKPPGMDNLNALFQEYWPHIIFAVSMIISATAATHAAMNKQDVRAAIAWVGVILLSPLFGSLVYLIAGINRVRYSQLQQQRDRSFRPYFPQQDACCPEVADISGTQFDSLCKVGDRVSRFPLQGGNVITRLNGGDDTYPAMIQAIDGAVRTIALQSYIFDNDPVGRNVAEALVRAKNRGVEIRVLIDAVGAKYSHPPISRRLRKQGIRTALFMTNPLGLRMP